MRYPTGKERTAMTKAIAKQERLIARQERSEKLQERNRNEKLAAYLKSLGVNPDDIS